MVAPPTVQVLMLDADPKASAQAACDAHLLSLPPRYAQLLSAAWHQHANAAFWPLPDDEADDVLTPWLSLYVRPASTPANPTTLGVPHYDSESRDSYWRLFGQRIFGNRWSGYNPDDVDGWAWQTGGNYRWLWQLAMAMCHEYTYRQGKRHPWASVLWTLELAPWALEDDTPDTFMEPPLHAVPDSLRVVTDGFYDCIPSLRAWYQEIIVPEQHWTKRQPPLWDKKATRKVAAHADAG